MNIDNKQLERDVENALRARGLKEQMHQWEAERKQSEYSQRKWKKIRTAIYSLSIAAAVIGVIFMTVPISTWQTTYHQLTRWGYQQYAHYVLKSQPKQHPAYKNSVETLMAMAQPSVQQIADSYQEQEILGHENPMHEAVWQILMGNYVVAQSILEDVKQNPDPNNVKYQTIMDDIAYLNALCDLGQNRRTKAKKALCTIANSSSKHSEIASALTKEIK